MKKKAYTLFALDELIFVTISIMFFGLFLFFVVNSSSNIFVLEEFYAKQIALLVDGSQPNTIIGLDITDYYNIAEDKKWNMENRFSVSDNKIVVRLTNSKQRYIYPYVSDLKAERISYNIVDVDGKKRVFLNIELVENE